MEYDYLKYPRSVVALAGEINRVVNDYDARKINNDQMSEIILWYANNLPGKLFKGQDYLNTIKKYCGARRVELMNTVLREHQAALFKGV